MTNSAPLLPRALLVALLCNLLLLSSCKKEEKAVPVVVPGAIRGQVATPFVSATVVAADMAGHTATTTSNADGRFLLRNLVPGTYTVQFTVAPGYVVPRPRTATVVTADTADLAAIEVFRGEGIEGGAGECRLNGDPFTDRVYGNQSVGLTTVTLLNIGYRYLGLTFDNLTGTGTGTGTGTVALDSVHSAYYGYASGSPCGQWNTRYGGGGTATITRYDLAARRISGTFSFTARYYSNNNIGGCGGPPITVTNGAFTDVPF